MICERCNTENLDGSQYCDECGAQLSGSPRARSADAEPGEAGHAISLPGSGERPSKASEGRSVSHSDGAPLRPASAFVGRPEASERGELNVLSASASGSLGGGKEARPSPGGKASAVASVAPHAKLVIYRGRSVGKEFPMSEDETHIGRWDADGGIFPDVDLDADDPEAKVSRRHARITRRGGQYFVEDLGSTNGTFINRGRRLLPGDRHPLHDGDEVIVGKTFLRFNVMK